MATQAVVDGVTSYRLAHGKGCADAGGLKRTAGSRPAAQIAPGPGQRRPPAHMGLPWRCGPRRPCAGQDCPRL